MNSKFDLIFIGFVVNIINVFNVFIVYANRLDSLVYYDDNAISELQLTSKDIFNLHHSFVIEDLKWENGQINFKIDQNFTDEEIEKILEAMHEIESFSCIQFAPYDPYNGPEYVMIRKDYSRSGSSAHLGCLYGGEQNLSLSVEMIYEHQTILHELMHAIGFGHHHQRSDRDKYIEIHLENTNLSDSDVRMEYATNVKPDDRVTYLTPFDFNSVMMYDDDEYSVNSKPVLTSKIEGKKVPSFRERNRGLSKYDIILLNRFYDCHIVDKKKSKIIYEDEKAILRSKVVNYHEMQRAEYYLVENEPERGEQYQPDKGSTKAPQLLRETLAKSRKSMLPPELLEETDQFDQQYRYKHYGDDEDLIDRPVTFEANTNSANSVPYDQIPSADKQLHEESQKEQLPNVDLYVRLLEFYAEIRSILDRLKRFFEENEQLELVDTDGENEDGLQEENENGVQEDNELNVQEENEIDVQEENEIDVHEENEIDVHEDNENDVQEHNKDDVQEDNELDIRKDNENDVQEDNENDVQEDNKDVVQEKNEGDVQQENEDVVQCANSGASRLSFINLQIPWL